MPLTEAYKTVWTKRPFIHINKGFLYQLYIYEKDVFGKNWTHFKTIKAQNNVQISSKGVLKICQESRFGS